jgi:D-alanyl-D-alanine carboxypeptidase/D-alanyl-D-alanine-endopeptidase (penicillin-binding protein 4)
MPKRFAPAVLMFMTGASPALSVPGAPPPVAQTMAAQHLPASGMSFAIIDPDTGRLIAGQNLDTPRSPASTIKVVTTFASLDLLGPAYVWHTRAAIRGEIHNGVLDGDLVLQGGGDPYMTLERWWRFARTLRDNGLKTIRGDIVIDNTAFSLPAEDPGAFDGRPNRSYNVLPDALMVRACTGSISLRRRRPSISSSRIISVLRRAVAPLLPTESISMWRENARIG